MNKKAYKALEYYKIIDLLTDKASSPMGKDLCRKLTPSTDIEEIRSMQLQTHDALARLFKKAAFPLEVSRISGHTETSYCRQRPERAGAAFRLQSSGKYRPCQSLFQK